MPRKAKDRDVSRMAEWYPERLGKAELQAVQRERRQAARRAEMERAGATHDAALARHEAARAAAETRVAAVAAAERAALEREAFARSAVEVVRPSRVLDSSPDVQRAMTARGTR